MVNKPLDFIPRLSLGLHSQRGPLKTSLKSYIKIMASRSPDFWRWRGGGMVGRQWFLEKGVLLVKFWENTPRDAHNRQREVWRGVIYVNDLRTTKYLMKYESRFMTQACHVRRGLYS